jgi:flagellar basal-body rod modification protein FlgD
VSDYVGKPNPTAAKKTGDKGDELGKDTFLKLLVAQLKYQDPTNPADSTQFLAQTAQFTTVEKLNDLETTQQDLLKAQLQLGASNLIGRTVTYQTPDTTKPADKDGNPVMKSMQGVVTSASFLGSTPTVKVGDTDVALSSITEVQAAAAAPKVAAPVAPKAAASQK